MQSTGVQEERPAPVDAQGKSYAFQLYFKRLVPGWHEADPSRLAGYCIVM
jgi:hypothetical protein